MQMKFLAAYTALEDRPPYLNFTADIDRAVVVVRGRERAKAGETYGRDFCVEIPKADFDAMILDCWHHASARP